jgi:hypothetical protein
MRRLPLGIGWPVVKTKSCNGLRCPTPVIHPPIELLFKRRNLDYPSPLFIT